MNRYRHEMDVAETELWMCKCLDHCSNESGLLIVAMTQECW